jgi:hypothetical protein
MSRLFRPFEAGQGRFQPSHRAVMLKARHEVLVKGCGLGDEVLTVVDALHGTGEINALDLSAYIVRTRIET